MLNKYTALERLQLFKSVASFGVLRSALIEESEFSGEACPDPDDGMVEEFASAVGFAKCESHDCDLWFNEERECFVEQDGKKICRMCCKTNGITVDF
jgi:hypothetical protein